MAIASLSHVPQRGQAALLDLYRASLDADEPAIYSAAIEVAARVTDSEIGYIHLVNDDQETIELGTWSAATLRVCNAVYDRHYPIDEAGVWADAARNRGPVVHNDYARLAYRRGLPEGHVPLVRHLGVPVLAEGRVVLLVGVGNKPLDYDDDDVDCLQAIADHAWALVRRSRERVALELAERQLHDLQELAAISIWEWDPVERVLRFDENVRPVLGLHAGQRLPASPEELLRFVDAGDHGKLLAALSEPPSGAAYDADLRVVRADGRPVTVHLRGSAYPRSQGRGVVLRGLLQDVTERRELLRARYQAGHDPLTGLANRASLLSELETALHHRRRSPDDAFAVLFVDLDRFKAVNDTFGHHAGDAVLKRVADRLLHATRKEDLVARLGGDELVVVQRHVAHPSAAEALADKLIEAIGQPIEVSGRRLEVCGSIGIALSAADAETAEEILARADRAMYRAKRSRRGSYVVAA